MKTNTELRAGLYERVSTGTHDSAESRSVERQNQKGRAEVTRQGWRIVARYSDPGLSASRFARKSRPEWSRLMADIRSGMLDVVVLWTPSRGGRELEDWARFLNACSKHGVLIYLTQKNRMYDPRDSDDWDFLAGKGVESTTESNRISLLSRDGVADSANRGDPYGRIPFGYTRRYELDPHAHKGRKVTQYPHPKEAPVVREIITRIADNEAVSAVVKDLATRDIRTRAGGRWSRSSVVRLVLEGVVYIGKRRHNSGPLIDGNWPGIVEPEVYWAAVRILSDPARKPSGGGIRPGKAKHLLSYVAACEVCGGPLSMRHVPRSAGQTAYYRCVNGCVSAPQAWLDEMATVAVVGFCAKSPLYEILTRTGDEEAQAARGEAQAERDRLASYEEQAISGKISAESFARIASRIQDHITELDNRAVELATPPALRDLVSSKATQEERWEDIHERWLDMPLTARRSVISAIFAPVLYPSNGNPSDSSRFKMPLNPGLTQAG